MLDLLRKIFKAKYETLNLIQISAANLLANYDYLQSLQPTAAIFPVLKSNAYGHGLAEVCHILNASAAPLVAVDSYPEAQIVYRHFKRKVLILGEMPLKTYHYCRWQRTEFVIYNEATLRYLARFGKKVRVHLFVNSGMNREGIQNIKEFIVKNKKYLERVEISGLCSHLASAGAESILNSAQEANFMEALDALRVNGFFPRWVHLGNSAAIFRLNNQLLTAFRPGIAFYGYSPFDTNAKRMTEQAEILKPALSIFSHLVAVQDLKLGDSVSYDETYRAEKNGRVGVIPFGYFEGLDRRLSNQAKFLVKNESGNFWATIAGRVCMNLSCLDIGQNAIKIGDSVQIVSTNNQDPNSIVNLADLCATISYELLVKLQSNIRRQIT